MKKKKIFINCCILGVTVISPVAVISCLNKKNREFDIGYAMQDMNSLNYIKYKSASNFAHSVIESFVKSAPEHRSRFASYLQDVPIINYKNSESSPTQKLNSYSYTSGTLSSSEEFPGMESKKLTDDHFTFRLNGKSRWSNGDFLKPSDFIDSFVYVLDLNTGSQLLDDFLKLKIKNADYFVTAQTSYAKKYKQLYKNPFGYIKNVNYDASNKNSVYWVQRKDAFPLQIYSKSKSEIDKMPAKEKQKYLEKQKEERRLVDKISFFAKNLGIYADLNSSHPYTHIQELKKTDQKNNKYGFVDSIYHNHKSGESIYPNILQIQTAIKLNSFHYIFNQVIKSMWIPVNRKFIESIGGIEKFGLNLNNFLTQGPFNISRVVLGNNGFIILKKNNNYWDSKNTIPNKIKIFFQTDPVILFSLYQDGYISEARLNGLFAQKLYYSDEENNELLVKVVGYGTTAFVFNLDANSENYNPILADPDLRKALFYAIDRGRIIKISGYASSLPTYSFVDAFSNADVSWGGNESGSVSMLQKIGDSVYYDKLSSNNPKKMFPYKVSSFINRNSLIGDFDKKDLFKNDQLAKKYFSKFQKKYPGNHTITYTYDSSVSNLKIGIEFQSAIKKLFGNKLKIEIKGYPKLVYDTYYSSGKFEVTYKNLDYLIDETGGTSAFYRKDEINKKEQKNLGFLKNPTGGWTFRDVIKNKANQLSPKEKELKQRLKIKDFIWDKLYELSSIPDFISNSNIEEQEVFLNARLNAFLNKTEFTYKGKKYKPDPNFLTYENICEITDAANKLIMEFSPVIPLFVVDNFFKSSRIVNYRSAIGNGLQNYDYAYDYKNKPRNDLPNRQ